MRREQGLPTLSVLVGPQGLGVRDWRSWCDSQPRSFVLVRALVLNDVGSAWVRAVFEQNDIARAAGEWFCRGAGLKDDEFLPSNLTRFDLDRIWEALAIDSRTSTAVVARAILRIAVTGEALLPERLLEMFASEERVPIAFAGLAGLIPQSRWPSIVILPTRADNSIESHLRDLENLIGTCPALPVGLCLTNAESASAAKLLDKTRIGAIVREGTIVLESVSRRQLNEQLRGAGVEPLPPGATLDRLTDDGLSADAARAFVETAAAARTTRVEPERAAEFRSLAEKTLFDLLESRPETIGLFRPNQLLDFLHGVRRAEADLVAVLLKLVVELDGKYYHLNETTYRCDRRKDWLYQRHGYWVLRFLSEDVVDDLASILDTILDAVALRQSTIPGAEVTVRD